MTERLERELNNWSVQELRDVLDRYSLASSGVKKVLVTRLIESGRYVFSGPDYDRWTITAIRAEIKKRGVMHSSTRRSALIDKLKQVDAQKENIQQGPPSPKRKVWWNILFDFVVFFFPLLCISKRVELGTRTSIEKDTPFTTKDVTFKKKKLDVSSTTTASTFWISISRHYYLS